MCPERTCVLCCLPLLGPSALLAGSPWPTWPVSLLQSCQLPKGLWVHTVCRELDFYSMPSTNLHMGLFTLGHTCWCSCVIRQILLWVGQKGAGSASIPGIRECGTYARLPVLHKETCSTIQRFCRYLGQIEGYLECFPVCEGTEEPHRMSSL